MTITQELATTGHKEADIPVSISYRIIELFSAGLYSSPNKAIEELVANSYDAFARNVSVIIPSNPRSPDAVIWVIDDGTSMDDAGLFALWRLAVSDKRKPGQESKERPPIGKFGIGKLATYVLAKQLTYVCKSGNEYRAVTMDYTRVDQTAGIDTKVHQLPLRHLTEDEAKDVLASIIHRDDKAAKALPLFGPSAKETWTVAAMGNLTAMAQGLTAGRLRWVLSTALPLSPRFNLFLNGERLTPSRMQIKPLAEWQMGQDDKVAEKLKLTTRPNIPAVEIDGVGFVRGEAAIYEDPLTGGKANQWGRSHGFFVMVRGRLINIEDPLFGIPALSHSTFSRFRMVIHADGLDEVLRSTRETVMESEGVVALQRYLREKFNEARSWYSNWVMEAEYQAKLSTRIGATPQSLSRTPLLTAIRMVLDGVIPDLMLTQVPQGLDDVGKQALLDQLDAAFESETGLIKDVRLEPLGMDAALAVFDAKKGCVLVNQLHPFYANYGYGEHSPNEEPFELLAVAEILTEAYLLEEGVAPESVRTVLQRRDRFLRELVFSRQLAAPLVAEMLRASKANPDGLEHAVAVGLRSLGFEVSPIGGNGKPDGVALARMGVRDEASGVRSDYKITYDTKSTSKARVQAHTVGTGTIQRHRKDFDAQYALVIAPNFAGMSDDNDAIVKEAEAQQITLMAVEDFVRLVLVAATRQLGFTRLRELFEMCRRPSDATAWIDRILQEDVPAGPLPQILDVVWELMKDSPDPVKFAAVALKLRTDYPTPTPYREGEIREWMQSLRRLAGGYITIDSDVVSLEAPPDRILREVRHVSNRLPEEFRRELMVTALIEASDESEEQEK